MCVLVLDIIFEFIQNQSEPGFNSQKTNVPSFPNISLNIVI